MGKNYLLMNDYFDAVLCSSGFSSIRATEDVQQTQIVREGEYYGEIEANYAYGGETIHFDTGVDPAQEAYERRGGKVKVTYTYPGSPQKPLACENVYYLHGETLTQTFTFRNTGDQPLEILDLYTHYPSNTHFGWGQSAVDKLIVHSFMAGHGSYIYHTRLDLTGPYLTIFPTGDSKFEYYFGRPTRDPKKIEGEHRPDYLGAYIHAKGAHAEAVEKHGTNWRHPVSSRVLQPGESAEYSFDYFWVNGRDNGVREALYQRGSLDILSVPGYTLPRGDDARLSIRTKYRDLEIQAEYPDSTCVRLLSHEGDRYIYSLDFKKLGENKLTVRYDGGRKWTDIQYFITEPVRTLLEKRAKFLVDHQMRDESKWYKGLFCEVNNRTGEWMHPDFYDLIEGWRIYMVTCDDPGLAKPAFLSGLLAEYPDPRGVEAMDYYIQNYVWGGLQMTTEEEYPYAIYGTPNWYANRTSEDDGLGTTMKPAQLHLWRIYDYAHIALMYLNMYRIARDYPQIKTQLTAKEYLERAYETARAVFIYPMELDSWSAYKTGLYNELCYPEIIAELEKNGEHRKAQRLQFHWERKVRFFVNESTDLFGSEFPFDTTGFESTHAFAKCGLHYSNPCQPEQEHMRRRDMPYDHAIRFMRAQINSNLACRGTIEPAYFWYGSDYRPGNYHSLLAYMSPVCGWALMDYSLYYAEKPFDYLRIGYGSMLSSYAILNTGDEESNYGYWYPGKEMDGASCGVYEASPYGYSWLGILHPRGVWFYSGESDLTWCGSMRGMHTILTDDPIFGKFVYGGNYREEEGVQRVTPRDGILRRFHIVSENRQLNMVFDRGHFVEGEDIRVSGDYSRIELSLDASAIPQGEVTAAIGTGEFGEYRLLCDGQVLEGKYDDGITLYTFPAAGKVHRIVLEKI